MVARSELSPAAARKRDVPGVSPDTIRCYFSDLNKIRERQPLLNRAQEVKLAKRIEAGRGASEELGSGQDLSPLRKARLLILKEAGDKARKTFIEANLGLVIPVANRYAAFSGMPFADLIQEGNIGILLALEKFDWRRGFKFSTYANWWIRQTITRAIVDKGRVIRLPLHTSQDVSGYVKTRNSLTAELGREPSVEETAEKMGISLKRGWELAFWESGEPVSLDTPVGESGEGTLADLIEDTSLSSEKAINELAAKEEVKAILAGLTEREKRILQMRYVGEMTLERIAAREGEVTRERIRQIIARIESRIRGSYRRSGNGPPA